MVADVISCDKLLRHPRGLVWELISSPDMYPMFFTGVGSCETLIESTEAGPDPEYVVLSAKVKARVRLILSNTKESLAIEGVDNDGLISVRLFEEPVRARPASESRCCGRHRFCPRESRSRVRPSTNG